MWLQLQLNCNFIKKRLQHRLFPVKFATFLRTPCFKEHLQWLLLKVSGFQPATLLKNILAKLLFCEFYRIFKNIFSLDRTPLDDWFLCLSVNFEKFFRTPSKHFIVGSTLFLGWYDVATSHNVKSLLKQRCVRQRCNLQRLTTLKQRCHF